MKSKLLLESFFLDVLVLTVATFGGVATGHCATSKVRYSIADVTWQRLLNAHAEPDSWMTAGRDYSQSYYSPLANVNKRNIRKLGFAWAYDIGNYRVLEATPLVVDGVMFTSGTAGRVYALDARTGAKRWTFAPDILDLRSRAAKSCCGMVNRGVAVWRGKVYVASFDGYLYALDAATGSVVWKADTINDRSRAYTITGAPYIAKDLVIIGNGGADFDARGYITAYDHATGKQAWRFFTVPGDPAHGFEHPELEMAARTWSADTVWSSGLGGTAWDGMAYDPVLNLLYVGTGNGTPWQRKQRSPGGGDNLFLSSILAINPDDGRLVWYYQTVPGESWDYTATQKLILADLVIDGEVRQVIMQAPKNGFFYVLDRKTGKLLSATPFVKVTWASQIDLDTGRPVETGQGDYSGDPRLIFPGAWGGHSWHPMAYNPTTGLVYLPALDIPMVFAMSDGLQRNGSQSMAIHVPMTGAGQPMRTTGLPPIEMLSSGQPDRRARAYLKAWSPVLKRVIWEADTTNDTTGFVGVDNASGVMTTGAGLVFQGRKNGELFVMDGETGTVLHRIAIGNPMVAAPMTYKVGGVQYVAIMGAEVPGIKARIVALKLGGGGVPTRSAADQVEAVNAASPLHFSGTAAQIERGRELFERHCATCHASGRAPDLSRMNQQVRAEFMDIVMHGRRAERGMGDFSAVLSEEDAKIIAAYLENLDSDHQVEFQQH